MFSNDSTPRIASRRESPSRPEPGADEAQVPDGTVVGAVLAAGSARRFGSSKQLATLDGRPLLEHALKAMAGSRTDRKLVVLGANRDEIQEQVPLHGHEVVVAPDWDEGQSRSLAAAIRAAGECEALVVTLGDQPLITTAAIDRIIEQHDPECAATRAGYGGRPGHPVLLTRPVLDRALDGAGDEGARNLIAGSAALVECGDVADDLDIDSPGDLALIRGRS